MLLTFIFNYFSSSEVFTASLPDFSFAFFNLESRIPSSCTRWIFMLHIQQLTQHRHTRTRRESLTRKKHEEILFYAMCTRNPLRERAESRVTIVDVVVVVVFFPNRKYGRNREPVLVGEHHRLFSPWKGKCFLIKLTPSAGRFSLQFPRHVQSSTLREISTTFRASPADFFFFNQNKIKCFYGFLCITSNHKTKTRALQMWTCRKNILKDEAWDATTSTDIFLRSLSFLFEMFFPCCCLNNTQTHTPTVTETNTQSSSKTTFRWEIKSFSARMGSKNIQFRWFSAFMWTYSSCWTKISLRYRNKFPGKWRSRVRLI